MTATKKWRELYLERLRQNPDVSLYIPSVTILQGLYREVYEEVHGVRFVPMDWQANVPAQYLSSKGQAVAYSWLLQRIGELTYPTTCVD